MTARRICPPAPGPLETFAAQFDPLLGSFGQRRSFRTYLTGLLAPRDRNKTLTALAEAEPGVQAQAGEVQRLQFFVSEASWQAQAFSAQRLQLLQENPLTATHAGGVLALDDTGDRKGGHAIDHVARQYLGSVGKIDNGIVAVTSLWADERLYYPLHVQPYTPAERLSGGKADARFHTKPQIALKLIEQAQTAKIRFKAVIADCFYGDNAELAGTLGQRKIPYVLAHRGGVSCGWGPAEEAHSFEEALEGVPGKAWMKVHRRFADGHTERWWAIELAFLYFGPHKRTRAICVTTHRRQRPEQTTWYLSTNIKNASLEEIVALYAMRNWTEAGYKGMKDELGWADFQVRSDRAIRRHWELVCCAFAFCWWSAAREGRLTERVPLKAHTSGRAWRTKKKSIAAHSTLLARGATPRARLARPHTLAHALLARMESQCTGAPAAARRHTRRRERRRGTQSLSPSLTNHR